MARKFLKYVTFPLLWDISMMTIALEISKKTILYQGQSNTYINVYPVQGVQALSKMLLCCCYHKGNKIMRNKNSKNLISSH